MRPRDISIHPVLNGFVVNVGCQTVVVHSCDELGRRITEYYKHPKDVEKQFIENKVNDTLGPEVCEPPPQLNRMEGVPMCPPQPPTSLARCDAAPAERPR